MAKKWVIFNFPPELIREPVIYNFGREFEVVTNILRADISEDRGWVMLELEGEEEAIERGIAWVTSRGVRVEEATPDLVEDSLEENLS